MGWGWWRCRPGRLLPEIEVRPSQASQLPQLTELLLMYTVNVGAGLARDEGIKVTDETP